MRALPFTAFTLLVACATVSAQTDQPKSAKTPAKQKAKATKAQVPAGQPAKGKQKATIPPEVIEGWKMEFRPQIRVKLPDENFIPFVLPRNNAPPVFRGNFVPNMRIRPQLGVPIVWSSGAEVFDTRGFLASANKQITSMAQVCKLNEKQVRKLRVAAKGAAQKIKDAADEKAANQLPNPNPNVLILRQAIQLDDQLRNHPLWKRCVKQILTEEQHVLWKSRVQPSNIARDILRRMR